MLLHAAHCYKSQRSEACIMIRSTCLGSQTQNISNTDDSQTHLVHPCSPALRRRGLLATDTRRRRASQVSTQAHLGSAGIITLSASSGLSCNKRRKNIFCKLCGSRSKILIWVRSKITSIMDAFTLLRARRNSLPSVGLFTATKLTGKQEHIYTTVRKRS